MSDYRDYGQFKRGEETLPGTKINIETENIHYGQPYLATHDGNQQRLDYMWRSFISFTYGGRAIEDFDLIAVTSGDRLNRLGSAQFTDNTSSYDNLSGQQYWKTHYQANTLELNLATDGIDQAKLEDFLHWFSAGEAKELILAEHPNRAILARVSEPPQLNLLPFSTTVDMKISTHTYQTYTTLYKGEIILRFVMDDPFWYAKDNLLGLRDDEHHRYTDQWVDARGNIVNIFASQDALKILYEDGIPLGTMIQKNMLLGNGGFASVENNITSRIWDPDSSIQIANNKNLSGSGALIDDGSRQFGVIAGAIIDIAGNGIVKLKKEGSTAEPEIPDKGYFYYSGTAPAPTIIEFTMTPIIDSSQYIVSPRNSKSSGDPKYNTITIKSANVQELRFTTPNLFSSYNKAIEIFKAKANNNYTQEDIRQSLRDEVRHASVRAWAIEVVNNTVSKNADAYCTALRSRFTTEANSVTFRFNSENGEAIGIFKNANGAKTFEEDVGDMLRSNYIILRDRNHPTIDGYVSEWTENDKLRSHCITHDVDGGITNLQILYKNMYL